MRLFEPDPYELVYQHVNEALGIESSTRKRVRIGRPFSPIATADDYIFNVYWDIQRRIKQAWQAQQRQS